MKTEYIIQEYNPTISINKKSQNIIDYLALKLTSIEWSGIVFYTINGTADDDFNIHIEDVLPLDIGNSVHTDFHFGDHISKIASVLSNSKYLNYRLGLIHSHHSMSTEFSTTDQDTLLKNAADFNPFLSLIVNISGKYSAKLAVNCEVVKSESYEGTYQDFDYTKQVVNLACEENINLIQIFDCLVQHEELKNLELDNFIQTQLLKPKKYEQNNPNAFQGCYLDEYDEQYF